MPTKIDEAVVVQLAADGEPLRFTWRYDEYVVIGVPQVFFRRSSWWQQPAEKTALIDRELWRVVATPTGETGDARTYDLALGPGETGWQLKLVWE